MPTRHSVTKVLLVRLSAYGDVVQTLPLLYWLKQAHPNIEIGWLVEADAAALLQDHPWINHLHISPRKSWLKRFKNPLEWFSVWKEINDLRNNIEERRYDLALDIQGLLKSAVWPWLTQIPQRIGFSPGREWSHLFYTKTFPRQNPKSSASPQTMHSTHEFAMLLASLGITSEATKPVLFPLSPTLLKPDTSRLPIKEALTWVEEQHQQKRLVLAFAPATIWPSKHWPETYWKELQTLLSDGETSSLAISILWLGGPDDIPLVGRVKQDSSNKLPSYDLTGKTRLHELFSILNQVDFFVGPDSAPLHVANALTNHYPLNTLGQTTLYPAKRPIIIGLYGPTQALRTGPNNALLFSPDQDLAPLKSGNASNAVAFQSQLPCQPCHSRTCSLPSHECMLLIKAKLVYKALLQLAEDPP